MSRRMQRRKPSPSDATEDASDGASSAHVDPNRPLPSALLASKLFGTTANGTSAAAAAAAAIVDPVAAATALGLISPPNHATTKEPDVGAITAEANKLFATGGDAAVQARLQQEIQKTKKIVSDIATMRKRADAAAREKDAMTIEYQKACAARDTIKAVCTTMIKEIETLDMMVKVRATEDSTRREEIRNRIETEIATVTARLDEQLETKKALDAENIVLREELATLRAEFEAKFDGYQKQWKEREAATKTVIAALQDASMRTATLKEAVKQKELTLRELVMGRASLAGQMDLYQSRFSEFESVATQSQSVYDVATKQQQELQSKIDDLEALKKQDVEQRVKAEAECQKTRQSETALKKRMEKLEKQKATLEEKCRALQLAKKKQQEAAAAATAPTA